MAFMTNIKNVEIASFVLKFIVLTIKNLGFWMWLQKERSMQLYKSTVYKTWVAGQMGVAWSDLTVSSPSADGVGYFHRYCNIQSKS